MLNLREKKYLTDSCYYLNQLWMADKLYDFQVERAISSLKETIKMLESIPDEALHRSTG